MPYLSAAPERAEGGRLSGRGFLSFSAPFLEAVDADRLPDSLPSRSRFLFLFFFLSGGPQGPLTGARGGHGRVGDSTGGGGRGGGHGIKRGGWAGEWERCVGAGMGSGMGAID